ncbi:hypothetical protein P4B09_09720 [Lactiplantibacillus plantarum]|nr:hypothetical protein [Lactiplantibacillus plantarum]MDP5372714.1 hypothetical protein [Lactiplantibacillus plantarum]
MIRHGQTYFNKYRRMQGWCDSPSQLSANRTLAMQVKCSTVLISMPFTPVT